MWWRSSHWCGRQRPPAPTAVCDSAGEKPRVLPQTVVARHSLTPRALLRIGTDDLRTRSSFVTDIAFSPDSQLVAAAEANAPVPRVSLFDVRTGRLVKLISPPDRPPGWVQCIAFSPDQTSLAWGEVGGEVAVWNLTHDRIRFREKLHGQSVNDVTFSRDAQVLASGGEDGVVHLLRADDPREVVQVLATGEKQPARHRAFADGPPAGGLPVGPLRLAFTSDGGRLIVGSGSSATISLWRIRDGQLIRRIENAHGDSRRGNAGLSSIAVTPDGRRILSAGESTVPITQTKLKYGPRNVSLTEIRLWDLETGKHIQDLLSGEYAGRGYAALSRDGRHLAVGDYGILRIVDVATGTIVRTISLPGSGPNRPAFSPDGALVALAINNVVGIFDVRTGRRLHHDERTPDGYLEAAAWSPTGDRIVTGHGDGEVRVWEASTGKLVWHKPLAPAIGVYGRNAGPAFVAFTRDSRHLVAAGQRDDPVRYSGGIVAVFDATTGAPEREADQETIRWAALAPSGRMVVVATSHGAWDNAHFIGIEVDTGRTRWINPPAGEQAGFVQLAGMQFQGTSSLLQVALRDGNVIRFNGLTGREQRRFLADGRIPQQQQAGRRRNPDIFTAAFSADGRTMVSSSGEWVCVWDVEAGTLRRRIRHTSAHGCFLALSPDGKTIATSGVPYAGPPGEDTIRLYDAENGEPVLTLEPADDRAHTLAFSPDGTKLLTGLQRGSLIVWDVRRGQVPSGQKE